MPEAQAEPDFAVRGRRKARLTFAVRRLEKMLDTEPRFTDEEREQLAAILRDHGRGTS